MKIEASGDCMISFTPMAPVHATTFDFHYVGTATASLKTSKNGAISFPEMDRSKLRAFATVRMGGRRAPLLTDVPVENMVQTVGPRMTAESSSQGIDSAPVLSANAYACRPSALILSSGVAHTQWIFRRVTN